MNCKQPLAQVNGVFVQLATAAALAVHGLLAVAEAEVAAAVVARPAVFAVAEVVVAAPRQDALAVFEFGGGAVFAAHVGVVHLQFGATVAVVHPEGVVTGGKRRYAFEEGGLGGAGGKKGSDKGERFIHGW